MRPSSYGYTVAQTMVYVLKQCGDDLTRANIMKQAASIKNLELGGFLPGVKINTSADRFCAAVAAATGDVQGRYVDRGSATSSARMSAAERPASPIRLSPARARRLSKSRTATYA